MPIEDWEVGLVEEFEDSQNPPKKKIDFKKLLILAGVGLNLVTVFAGAAFIYTQTIGYVSPYLTEAQIYGELQQSSLFGDGEPILYTMEAYTVNLSTPRHVLNVELTLEMLNEDGFEEVVTLGPRARDAVMRILSAKTIEELESIQGKLQLKDQISLSINDFLKTGVVKDVFFSHFVVQVR